MTPVLFIEDFFASNMDAYLQVGQVLHFINTTSLKNSFFAL